MKRWITVMLLLMLIVPVAPIGVKAAIPDGEYDVDFNVLKESSDELSMANDQVKKPAKLIVRDGKIVIELTITGRDMWKTFEVEGKPVQTIKESGDEAVVQFEVSDVTKPVEAFIHVVVENINYDNKYTIRFDFDTSNIEGAGQVTSTSSETKKPNTNETAQSPATSTSASDVVTSAEASDGSAPVVKNPKTSDEAPIVGLLAALSLSAYGLYYARRRETEAS
ncbi:hypothetical protein GOP80_08315 [Planococcaceae bacterium Storch 2/2-2]|nr:hypothetical protein [Planococcaceae bacterium Storch 2/2-2]